MIRDSVSEFVSIKAIFYVAFSDVNNAIEVISSGKASMRLVLAAQ
ncbi:hypothetical protein [Parachryseolinea silvisoli]|nr:hypothetical protein [Parachryseolinea silvisoli]